MVQTAKVRLNLWAEDLSIQEHAETNDLSKHFEPGSKLLGIVDPHDTSLEIYELETEQDYPDLKAIYDNYKADGYVDASELEDEDRGDFDQIWEESTEVAKALVAAIDVTGLVDEDWEESIPDLKELFTAIDCELFVFVTP